MRTRFLLVATLAAMLAGCGSPPKLQMPDGSGRTPINSDADIRTYMAHGTLADAGTSKREGEALQLEAVKRQLAAMRTYISLMATNLANAPKPIPTVTGPKPRQVGDGETLEVRDQSIIFRVSPLGSASAFSPSRDLQAVLLRAAREGRRIEVRGRTNTEVESKASNRDARDEAQSARDFLVRNGIPASKIRMSYSGAGAFVLDNSTERGRAFNRRVEIETMDMDTSAYRPSVAPPAMTNIDTKRVGDGASTH